MGLVEEKPQVEATDIDHDGLLFSNVAALVAVELEVAVFIESLLLTSCGYIVENIHLRCYFGVMGDQFDLLNVCHSVELEGNFLREGAETPALPSFRACEEKGGNRVLLLF